MLESVGERKTPVLVKAEQKGIEAIFTDFLYPTRKYHLYTHHSAISRKHQIRDTSKTYYSSFIKLEKLINLSA